MPQLEGRGAQARGDFQAFKEHSYRGWVFTSVPRVFVPPFHPTDLTSIFTRGLRAGSPPRPGRCAAERCPENFPVAARGGAGILRGFLCPWGPSGLRARRPHRLSESEGRIPAPGPAQIRQTATGPRSSSRPTPTPILWRKSLNLSPPKPNPDLSKRTPGDAHKPSETWLLSRTQPGNLGISLQGGTP